MDVLSLNTPTAFSFAETGTKHDYALVIPTDGKYVVEFTGSANVLCGVYGPFHAESELVANGIFGKLRICGAGRRGVRMLTPGTYLVQLTSQSGGDGSVTVRNWSFWDYFTINSYKSTC